MTTFRPSQHKVRSRAMRPRVTPAPHIPVGDLAELYCDVFEVHDLVQRGELDPDLAANACAAAKAVLRQMAGLGDKPLPPKRG